MTITARNKVLNLSCTDIHIMKSFLSGTVHTTDFIMGFLSTILVAMCATTVLGLPMPRQDDVEDLQPPISASAIADIRRLPPAVKQIVVTVSTLHNVSTLSGEDNASKVIHKKQ